MLGSCRRLREVNCLALPARQALAALLDFQVVALGVRAHEVVHARDFAHAEQVVVVVLVVAHLDILADGAGEEPAVLEHDPDVFADVCLVDLADVDAVN
jgi:hypothetical protein